jgi:cob(I)alamin adenosyltransferase
MSGKNEILYELFTLVKKLSVKIDDFENKLEKKIEKIENDISMIKKDVQTLKSCSSEKNL